MSFDLVQMIYWLSLSAWFGLVLFGAMASPVIFRTVQEADPTLPTVLSVNLGGQHGTLLSMTIVAQVMVRLVWVQLLCAGGLFVAIILQWALLGGEGAQSIVLSTLRSVLYLMAAGLLIYGWRSVWSRIDEYRKRYIDNADNPEVALPVRDQLTKAYRESEVLQLILASVLSAMILFSASLSRPSVVYNLGLK